MPRPSAGQRSTASPPPHQEQGLCSAAEVLQAQGEQASPGRGRKYHTICSAEQRRAYEAAFSADYTEYRDLHARIGNVSQKFIQLGAKMKTLKQGTEERKASGRPGARRHDTATLRFCSPASFGFQALEAIIVHEYSHFKKVRLDAGQGLGSLSELIHIGFFFPSRLILATSRRRIAVNTSTRSCLTSKAWFYSLKEAGAPRQTGAALLFSLLIRTCPRSGGSSRSLRVR